MQVPALQPTPWSHQGDLTIKATHTGIVFLANKSSLTGKYEQQGRFGKRYLGSKTCAVDINGGLWLSKKEHDDSVKRSYLRFKGMKEPSAKDKKKAASTGCELSNFPEVETTGVAAAIYTETPETKIIGAAKVKEVVKKAYRINKVEVRHRLYAYRNTQKGKKRLFFWTVSFPEGTPDKVCHQLFNIWLTQLRKYKMIHDYLWIKERQDGKRAEPGKAPTNTLHFHIAIPHYLDVYKANRRMSDTLKTYAARGDMPGAMCNVATRKVHYLPCIKNYNGVDIAKHRTTRRPINFALKKGDKALASYLTKYLTKTNDDNGNQVEPTYEQLAWHNSRGFSCLFTAVTFNVSEFFKGGCSCFLNRCKVYPMRYCTFIPWGVYGMPPQLEEHLYNLNSYIQFKLDERRQQT